MVFCNFELRQGHPDPSQELTRGLIAVGMWLCQFEWRQGSFEPHPRVDVQIGVLQGPWYLTRGLIRGLDPPRSVRSPLR